MSNFKLIGIRPLARCHKRFIKNLQPGIIYQFYQEYSICDKDGNGVRNSTNAKYVLKEQLVPIDLYDSKDLKKNNGIRINISAIAGKNGTGKSTLADLFFAAVFVLSVKGGFLEPNTDQIKKRIKKVGAELTNLREKVKTFDESRLAVERDFNTETSVRKSSMTYKQLSDQILANFRENELLEQIRQEKIKEINNLSDQLPEYNRLLTKVRAQVFYELDNVIYELTLGKHVKNGIMFRSLPCAPKFELLASENEIVLGTINPQTLIPHFFYTIAVNYSHYSLNSKFIGDWIKLLFHKNDGYKTPLVINPMRTDGNFDINKEMGFARNRLLSNVLLDSLHLTNGEPGVMIAEHQYIDKVIFKLDKEKIGRIPKMLREKDDIELSDERATNMIGDLLELRFRINDISEVPDFLLRNIILNYLVNKIDNISENYAEFRPGYVFDNNLKNEHNITFLTKLIEDRSHITYKFHQALNFLRYHLYEPTEERMFNVEKRFMAPSREVRFFYSMPVLHKWMEGPVEEEIMRCLPPSIFEVDFQLANSRGVMSRFSSMSSGEQQIIHTIQSIIYHINNIQSVHYNTDREHYQAINIILDEIELYFHPDMQRKFIARLTKSLQQLRLHGKNKIEAINLLFLTHSPFILSDIPSKNVLRLEVKRKNGKAMIVSGEFETFAANIHDLLAKSFFINGTSMGEFAEAKINALIEKIDEKQSLTTNDYQLIDIIGDSFLKSSITKFINQKSLIK